MNTKLRAKPEIRRSGIGDPQNTTTGYLKATPEFIHTLLYHYRDVLEGIRDQTPRGSCSDGCSLANADRWLCRANGCANEGVLALMCESYNHPSYQRLEQLLGAMDNRNPRQRHALRSRYERYTEKRVAWCRKCGEHPITALKAVHRHPPGRSVVLKPKIVRVLPLDDDPKLVAEATVWLAANFARQALLPKAIEEIESQRALIGVS